VNLSADPTGKLAYGKQQATVRAGRVPIRLVNNSSLPHNLMIAKGAKVLGQTKDGLRRFGDHRGPGSRRVRLLLLGRRTPGCGDAGDANRQVSGCSDRVNWAVPVARPFGSFRSS
jgi:hypothetical protein